MAKRDTAAAVADVIDARAKKNAPPVVKRPRGRPKGSKLNPSKLSQNADAIRRRERRERASHADEAPPPPAPPPADPRPKFTPGTIREMSDLPPGEPVKVVPSPEDTQRAVKFVALIITAAGHVAAAVFKDDVMKVPAADASETAELIVDGWPDLAVMDGDGKKWLATMAIGSLVAERYGQYNRRHVAGARPSLTLDKSPPASSGPMEPGVL